MFQENIDFIRDSVHQGHPEYGIISLVADTFDAMRAMIAEDHFEEVERYRFVHAMNQVVEGLYALDEVLDGHHPDESPELWDPEIFLRKREPAVDA